LDGARALGEAGDAGQDFVGRFSPHEGLGIFVVHVDIFADGGFQLSHAAEHAVALLHWKCLSNNLDVLLDASASGVDHNVLAIPWMIFARNYFLPSRKSQSENIWFAPFHASSMLTRIGTYDFDFNGGYLRAPTDFEPSIARNRQRVNGVCDYCAPDAKVIFGNSIGDPISCVVKARNNRRAISDRLLNRVDA